MDKKKYDRLPKWTKDEIRLLESNVEYWKNQTRSITEKKSNVIMQEGLKEIYLPKNSHIRFYLPTKENFAHIDVRHIEPNILNINGSTSLHITPRASNSVDIKIER